MSKNRKMINSAQNAMIHVMNLSKNDKVLIITDKHTEEIGEAFYNAAIEFGCSAQIYFLPEKGRPLFEIPSEMSELAKNSTIIINVFKGMAEETPFRGKWIKEIVATKSIRLGHGPSITKSMMLKGPMNIDYKKMAKISGQLIKSFKNAKKVHVTAPGGTDIVLDIENRDFSTDTQISKEPYFVNLPCGEIWCAPIETEGNGIIVCDGSIGDIGKVRDSLIITVKNGKAISFESKDQELTKQVEELTSLDEEARIIGELGIGLNPGAKLSGILLEDEKALKTVHIAFGNNENMDGGQNTSITHRDFLFYNPTLKITYKDNTNNILIEKGEFSF